MQYQNKLLLSNNTDSADLITLHVASVCLPNNDAGIMTYGVVITQYDKEIESFSGRKQLKNNRASNIAAEYIAMVYGLNYLITYELQHHPIDIITSIQMCARLRDANESSAYASPANYLKKLIDDYKLTISFTWQPRTENQKAAALAMDHYQEIIKG